MRFFPPYGDNKNKILIHHNNTSQLIVFKIGLSINQCLVH